MSHVFPARRRRAVVFAAALLCAGSVGALPVSASATASSVSNASTAPITGQLAYMSVGGAWGSANGLAVIDARTSSLVDYRTIPQYVTGIAVDPAGARVYGAAQGALVVLDAATDATLGTISVGGANNAVALSPSGATAYVADSDGSGSTVVVNTATQSVTATIAAGGRHLALNPAGTRLYATNAAGKVSVINTATNTVVGTATCGTSSGSVAVNPAGTRAYVADLATRDVCVIDTATNSVLATVTLPSSSNPMDIVVNPAGTTAYVPTNPITRVYAINLATNTVATSFVSYGSVAEAIDPTGSRLYSANDRTMDDGSFAALDIGSGTYPGWVGVPGEPSAIALGPVASGTTTSLAVSPSGTTAQGTTVTLTAAVSGATSGTVQFYDSPPQGVGPTPLGAPVAVSGGTAAISTSTLIVGTHSLSAAFTPSTTGLLRSASAQVSLVVNP